MQLLTRRILFTDDNQDTRVLMTFILEQSAYAVETAATISETLGLAERSNFDLFILDSRLPDGSGIDLCKQIRTFDQRTPILFYSGSGYEKDKNLALSSGAQAYLIKPVDIPLFLQAVSELIGKSERDVKSGEARKTIARSENG